jgi:hypothetical protein
MHGREWVFRLGSWLSTYTYDVFCSAWDIISRSVSKWMTFSNVAVFQSIGVLYDLL